MTNPIINKKKISTQNKLNDLTAKEWLINTKSVWEYSDYHLNNVDRKEIRHLRNLILFFTKRNNIILNPNNDSDIKTIGEQEGRIVLTNAMKEVDFILIQEKRDIPHLMLYEDLLLSDKFKSKLIHYYHHLKNNKYLCVIVRDFYFQKNCGLILYHYDLANLLITIGFNLKGLTIWVPSEKKNTPHIDNPNSVINNEYFLIFRKEKNKKEAPVKEPLEFQINYDTHKTLAKKTLFFDSYLKSIAPTRDKFKTQHPATFPEPDIKNLIEFYTDISKKPKILDPFCGVGSTLIACLELKVEGYGIELTKKWIDLTKQRFFLRDMPIKINGEMCTPHQKPLDLFMHEEGKKKLVIQNVVHGDTIEKLPLFPDNFFDFIATSPPYWGILTKKIDHKTRKERVNKGLETKYTREDEDKTFSKDLGNLDSYNDFLNELAKIFTICFTKLKNLSYAAIILSDFRDGPKFYLYHGDTANLLKKIGFKLIGLTVLHQDNKNLYPYGYPYSFVSNIHHQYIVIVKKEEI